MSTDNTTAAITRPTEEEIQRIEEVCAKATPGPWEAGNPSNYKIPIWYGSGLGPIVWCGGMPNAAFIAVARTALPALLAAYKQQAGENARKTKHLDDIRRVLRIECEELGDNDWPDDLHLGDVIEKHLARPAAWKISQQQQGVARLRGLAGEMANFIEQKFFGEDLSDTDDRLQCMTAADNLLNRADVREITDRETPTQEAKKPYIPTWGSDGENQ